MEYVLLFLPLLFFLVVPPMVEKDLTGKAYRYARDYLTKYYRDNKTFPDTLEIPGYPWIQYSHGGSPTDAYGIPQGSQAWAKVVFAGKDRQFGTADDRVLSLTASMLEGKNYYDYYRRSNVLEQAAYSICQRRLSEGISPIWPSSIDEVLKEANLPADYKYTPYGTPYIYDTSSCKSDTCDCSMAIVRAGRIVCTSPYALNASRYRCETAPVCPTGGTYDTVLDRCEAAVICPSGGSYNAASDRCEASPSISCPPGGSYNYATGYCEAPPTESWVCSISGASYSSESDCRNNCYYTVGKWHIPGTCSLSADCPSGYTYDSGVCRAAPSVSCPSGYTYVSVDGVCVAAPSCPAGYTKSGASCTAPAQCPDGGSLDAANDVCWKY